MAEIIKQILKDKAEGMTLEQAKKLYSNVREEVLEQIYSSDLKTEKDFQEIKENLKNLGEKIDKIDFQPKIEVNVPEIKIPEIKIPEIKVPKIEPPVIPEIKVPEPKVIVQKEEKKIEFPEEFKIEGLDEKFETLLKELKKEPQKLEGIAKTILIDPKTGEPYRAKAVAGATAPDPIGLKDASGTKINPAKEDGNLAKALGLSGPGTDTTFTITTQNTTYAIPTSPPTDFYSLIIYNASDTDVYFRFTPGTTAGVKITSGNLLSVDLGPNQQVYVYCGTAGKTINLSYKII
jgi:hypothetical protein